jgi:hypothetical protein
MMKDTAEVKGRASADADADEDAGLTFGLFSGLAEGYGIDCHSPAASKIFLLPRNFAGIVFGVYGFVCGASEWYNFWISSLLYLSCISFTLSTSSSSRLLQM